MLQCPDIATGIHTLVIDLRACSKDKSADLADFWWDGCLRPCWCPMKLILPRCLVCNYVSFASERCLMLSFCRLSVFFRVDASNQCFKRWRPPKMFLCLCQESATISTSITSLLEPYFGVACTASEFGPVFVFPEMCLWG